LCVTAKLKIQTRIENVYMMLMDWGELDSLFTRSSSSWGDNIQE
jgi:hypothetical protein